MKKIIVFILIFPVYIFALNVEQTYGEALSAYKAKNYVTSYELFSKIFLTKLSDVKFNFMLGRSAYETGHYEMALASFERVEILDPVNLRNKLEKARTYFMLKMYEDSEIAFKEVLDNPMLPKNVRSNIELYLSKVTGAQKKSFTYATINLDWIYDSNVNYGSLEDSYNIGTTKLANVKERSDTAIQTSFDFINIYDIGESNGFAIKNRFSLFLKNFKTESAYDIQYLGYIPSLVYKANKYKAELVLGLDTMTLAKKLYLKTVYIMPQFEHAHTHTLRSIAYFKYQKKFFQQTAQSDLNSNHYELSYALQDVLTPRSYVQATLVGIQEKKHQGTRVDVDYKEYNINAIYSNQFSNTYGGEVYAELKKRTYDDKSTLFNSKRDDTSKSISASISAKIVQTLRFNFKAVYNRVDSNQNPFSYQKYTISAGITKTF